MKRQFKDHSHWNNSWIFPFIFKLSNITIVLGWAFRVSYGLNSILICQFFFIVNVITLVTATATATVYREFTEKITNYFLLPPAMKLGQGYVFTGVCDSVHRGGGGLPQCMLGYHTPQSRHPREQTPPPRADTPPGADHPPGSRHPPGADTPGSRHTPPGSDTPPAQSMLGDTVNTRAVRILLECNLVLFCFLHWIWYRHS